MLRSFIITLGVAAMLAVPAPAQSKTIKFATMAPKGSPWHEILLDMVAEWEEAGDGNLKVRIYPGGVLGDEPDLIRKMAIRQIDGAMITSAGLIKLVPDMWIFGLPLMVRTYSELDFLRAQIGPDLKARMREKGFVVLNWGEAGWVRFFSNTPIITPDDLRKIKLFTWAGDQVLSDAWRKAGYDTVPLQATDLFMALSSGMVDAFSTTPVASLSFQWFGMAPYMLDMNWAPLVGATIIRRDSWEKIPEAVRRKMLAAAEKAGRRFRKRTRAFELEAVKVMVENGLTVTKVPPEALAAWEEGARGARTLILDRYVDPILAERSRGLLREYRAGLVGANLDN
jgi:TRAP-type C4-dicarboxylate transport system substrate-binding protein